MIQKNISTACSEALRAAASNTAAYLHVGAAHLPDLLDLAAALADEGAALGRRHDQLQGQPLLLILARAGAALAFLVLHLITNQSVGLQWSIF